MLSDAVESGAADDGSLQEALGLVDLEQPELAGVKRSYDKGDVAEAFSQYKRVLVERVASFESIESYSYWLHSSADADELVEGVLTTTQYGKSVETTTTIGLPGSVQWYKVPDDGYATLLRDITTMHWVTKPAEKYEQTGEVKYLRAWQGYWTDFAEHWPGQFEKAKQNPDVMSLVEKDSIAWSDIALYIGWRLENFIQGFNAVCHRAVEDGAIDAIDDLDLAKLLVHLDGFEAAKGVRWMEGNDGLPNQRVHCASEMFELGVYLNDFRNAHTWRELGAMEVRRSGCLADGSDMEQSLNYNAILPATLKKFFEAGANLPESEKGSWLGAFKEMYTYRYYFLHSLAKPNGALPIVGKNNTWKQLDDDRPLMPGLTYAPMIEDFSLVPLSKTVFEYVFEQKDVAAPAFDSIFFPYGGYVVLRDGWSRESFYCFMKTSRAGRGHMREGGNGLELSAYGQNIIVNSGGEMYTGDLKHLGYWHSTMGHNSISVDGYSQWLGNKPDDIPVTYDEPIKARFLDTAHFALGEGRFSGGYSGWNFKKHGTTAPKLHEISYDEVIEDVVHERQLILLKKQKLWIVTDIVDSASEHLFSQGWLLGPEYKPESVTLERNRIGGGLPGGVGFEMFHCGVEDLDYSKYYGVMEENCIMGWSGKPIDDIRGEFMPAMNLLAEWSGQGKCVLITVIVPFADDSPVGRIESAGDGFAMTMTDGDEVVYRYHGGDACEVELKTADAGLMLTKDGGHESAGGVTTPVITPDTFAWRNTDAGETPRYR